MAESSSRTSIIAALVGNLLIAVTKGVAAAITGSTAMLSESIHSTVDTGNEILLLYGQHRADQPPDDQHPLGYGREIYFWAFVVALLIFAVGACASVYEGVMRIRMPEPIDRAWINYSVLGLAMLFEGTSWVFAWKAFGPTRRGRGVWRTFSESKDPTSFMVLFEDSAALTGIVIALIGTFLAEHTQQWWIDGVSSVLIGLLLGAIALILARETKALLIGERASPKLAKAIRDKVSKEECVDKVVHLMTSQLAPDQVIATMGIHFKAGLEVGEVERLVSRIEDGVRADFPQLFGVFVRPQREEDGTPPLSDPPEK